jgi:pyrroloquinoline-quinone synthase
VSYLQNLNDQLDQKHLLKHPFYQAWSEGKLSLEYLGFYATQYFHHVDAFPRYISATHANCDDLPTRQILLDNLIDEEKGDDNHPELWLRFAEKVGKTREEVKNAELMPETRQLVETFNELSRSSYAEGLGALYAYERQVPDVAKSKIDGLKAFYNIDSPEALEFFKVHLEADVWHSQETADLMDKLSDSDKEKAAHAANKACSALWDFLSGVQRETVQTEAVVH